MKLWTITMAAVLALLNAGNGHSAVLWYNSEGQWIHYETRDFPVCYRSSIPAGGIRWQLSKARREWNNNTVVSLPRVSNCKNAIVIVRGRWLGHTGRSGYTYMPPTGDEQAIITLNLTYLIRSDRWNRRATACHEIGHVLGLDHAPGGCVGAGYFLDSSAHVSDSEAQLVNEVYERIP